MIRLLVAKFVRLGSARWKWGTSILWWLLTVVRTTLVCHVLSVSAPYYNHFFPPWFIVGNDVAYRIKLSIKTGWLNFVVFECLIEFMFYFFVLKLSFIKKKKLSFRSLKFLISFVGSGFNVSELPWKRFWTQGFGFLPMRVYCLGKTASSITKDLHGYLFSSNFQSGWRTPCLFILGDWAPSHSLVRQLVNCKSYAGWRTWYHSYCSMLEAVRNLMDTYCGLLTMLALSTYPFWLKNLVAVP